MDIHLILQILLLQIAHIFSLFPSKHFFPAASQDFVPVASQEEDNEDDEDEDTDEGEEDEEDEDDDND